MKKTITAITIAALTLSAATPATAVSVGSSGSSSISSDSTQSGTEKRLRDAAIGSYERTGFTLDPQIHALAQKYVKASGSDRSQIRDELNALGVTTASGGNFVSNEQALLAFLTIGEGLQLPSNGKRFGVGVDFGAATTEIQVFITS